MNEKIKNKIINLLKEKELITVGDLVRKYKWNYSTAEKALMELQIERTLIKIEHKKEKGFPFKYWRYKYR